MPQSLSNVLIHAVFSTKSRVPFLENRSLRLETHRYLGGVAKTLKCQPLIVGGVANHVHLLTTLARTVSIADFVKELKRVSSNWLQDEKAIDTFHWQSGCGVFSVSESQVAKARAYIEMREEHHRRQTFQDELKEPLHRHGIEFDERRLWD